MDSPKKSPLKSPDSALGTMTDISPEEEAVVDTPSHKVMDKSVKIKIEEEKNFDTSKDLYQEISSKELPYNLPGNESKKLQRNEFDEKCERNAEEDYPRTDLKKFKLDFANDLTCKDTNIIPVSTLKPDSSCSSMEESIFKPDSFSCSNEEVSIFKPDSSFCSIEEVNILRPNSSSCISEEESKLKPDSSSCISEEVNIFKPDSSSCSDEEVSTKALLPNERFIYKYSSSDESEDIDEDEYEGNLGAIYTKKASIAKEPLKSNTNQSEELETYKKPPEQVEPYANQTELSEPREDLDSEGELLEDKMLDINVQKTEWELPNEPDKNLYEVDLTKSGEDSDEDYETDGDENVQVEVEEDDNSDDDNCNDNVEYENDDDQTAEKLSKRYTELQNEHTECENTEIDLDPQDSEQEECQPLNVSLQISKHGIVKETIECLKDDAEDVNENDLVVTAAIQFPLTPVQNNLKGNEQGFANLPEEVLPFKDEIPIQEVQQTAQLLPLPNEEPSAADGDIEDNIVEEPQANEIEENIPSRSLLTGSSSRIPASLKLPETVTRLSTPEGSDVFLVGTAHFSRESQEDVATTIRLVRPDIVMVELCKSRTAVLQLDEETILKESKSLDFHKMRIIIQQHGKVQGILYLMLLSVSAHITKQLGMAPGGEFRTAFSEARRSVPGCLIQLGDRPIQITLSRALASLSVWQKMRLLWHIIASKEPISKEEVEKCKQKDFIEEMLAEMTGQFPAISEVFVKERDIYLTKSLQTAAEPFPNPQSANGFTPRVVVGVVGIGHVPGIVQRWGTVTDEDIPPIISIPPPNISDVVFKFTMKFTMYGLLGYGIYKCIPSSTKSTIATSIESNITKVSSYISRQYSGW